MQYICLLRGINVGGNNKVSMSVLKEVFLSQGCTNVSTYLNSGNVLFESQNTNVSEIKAQIESAILSQFGFGVQTLIKTKKQMQDIARAIPKNWENNTNEKTDVAYLFPEIDSPETLDKLPIKKEYLEIHYIPGAIYWNIKREHLNASRISKLVGSKCYKYMTVRNINTARFLGT